MDPYTQVYRALRNWILDDDDIIALQAKIPGGVKIANVPDLTNEAGGNKTVPGYDLTIVPAIGAALNLSPVSGTLLFNGTVATIYTNTLSVVNGTPGFSWSLVYGALPPGLTLTPNPTGSNSAQAGITGTPTSAGTYIFAVEVSDAANPTGYNGALYQITVQ